MKREDHPGARGECGEDGYCAEKVGGCLHGCLLLCYGLYSAFDCCPLKGLLLFSGYYYSSMRMGRLARHSSKVIRWASLGRSSLRRPLASSPLSRLRRPKRARVRGKAANTLASRAASLLLSCLLIPTLSAVNSLYLNKLLLSCCRKTGPPGPPARRAPGKGNKKVRSCSRCPSPQKRSATKSLINFGAEESNPAMDSMSESSGSPRLEPPAVMAHHTTLAFGLTLLRYS